MRNREKASHIDGMSKRGKRERVCFGFNVSLCSDVLDSKACIAICVNLKPCDIASRLRSLYFIEASSFHRKDFDSFPQYNNRSKKYLKILYCRNILP